MVIELTPGAASFTAHLPDSDTPYTLGSSVALDLAGNVRLWAVVNGCGFHDDNGRRIYSATAHGAFVFTIGED
jgi:hypothetical protein